MALTFIVRDYPVVTFIKEAHALKTSFISNRTSIRKEAYGSVSDTSDKAVGAPSVLVGTIALHSTVVAPGNKYTEQPRDVNYRVSYSICAQRQSPACRGQYFRSQTPVACL